LRKEPFVSRFTAEAQRSLRESGASAPPFSPVLQDERATTVLVEAVSSFSLSDDDGDPVPFSFQFSYA
jgi:hypothetical protein